MKLSVLSYSFRGLLMEGMMDVFGHLESLKYRYDLDAADLWSGTLASTDEDYLKKVKDALDERELVLADLAVDQANVWEDDAGDRERHHQNALAHLRAAEVLGARFVRIDAGGGRQDAVWTNEQFDHIVLRYKEYAQRAYDGGYKVGAENHWGPEKIWANMKKLHEAVDHAAFGVSCHIGGWGGPDADQADQLAAPWVLHTHFPWNITEGPLVEKMTHLRNAGYEGYYSVEHHTAKNEYTEVAVQLAKVRDVLERWRTEGTG
jgi:sugar phosphate isomerase/epimerase